MFAYNVCMYVYMYVTYMHVCMQCRMCAYVPDVLKDLSSTACVCFLVFMYIHTWIGTNFTHAHTYVYIHVYRSRGRPWPSCDGRRCGKPPHPCMYVHIHTHNQSYLWTRHISQHEAHFMHCGVPNWGFMMHGETLQSAVAQELHTSLFEARVSLPAAALTATCK